jgi:hypothetical protein
MPLLVEGGVRDGQGRSGAPSTPGGASQTKGIVFTARIVVTTSP